MTEALSRKVVRQSVVDRSFENVFTGLVSAMLRISKDVVVWIGAAGAVMEALYLKN